MAAKKSLLSSIKLGKKLSRATERPLILPIQNTEHCAVLDLAFEAAGTVKKLTLPLLTGRASVAPGPPATSSPTTPVELSIELLLVLTTQLYFVSPQSLVVVSTLLNSGPG